MFTIYSYEIFAVSDFLPFYKFPFFADVVEGLGVSMHPAAIRPYNDQNISFEMSQVFLKSRSVVEIAEK